MDPQPLSVPSSYSRPALYVLGVLFLLGVLHWIAFFYLAHPLGDESAFIPNRGHPSSLLISKSFTAHDWYKEIQYQAVVKEAIRKQSLPFHVPEFGQLFIVKERFLGAPIWTMSPQIVLLRFLDPFTFSVVNTLLLYLVGFLGCLLLSREYHLGLIPFSFLFLTFNFNGYFIGKVAAYGPAQLGYFFLPFFVWLIMKASHGGNLTRAQVYSLSLLLGVMLAAILYQGSLHLFIELFTFVILWGVVNWRRFRVTAISLLAASFLGALRLLPAAVTFGLAPTAHSITPHGYPLRNPLIFIRALGETTTHLSDPFPFAWWEFSLYVSWVGLALIFFFAFWGHLRRRPWAQFSIWRPLVIPLVLITLVSFGPIKKFIIPNFIPLLNAESLTSRYMIIPLLFVTVIASVNMGGFLRSSRHKRLAVMVVAFAIIGMAGFLFNHSRLWRMHRIQNEYDWVVTNRIFGELPPDLITLTIQNQPHDTLYVVSFWVGLFISLIAMLGVIWYLARTRETRCIL